MKRLTPLAGWLLIFGSLVVPASRVGAQEWLSDRDRAEGRGFRVGRIELHPGIGIEGGYDSNVFYSSTGSGSGMIRITPHFNVSTIGREGRTGDEEEEDDEHAGSAPMVNFNAGVSASYFEYFAYSSRRNVGIDTNLNLTIAPERPFSADITETFSRSVRPFTDPGPVRYARDQNNAGIRFNVQSRGGVFRGSLAYNLALDLYEDVAFQYANGLSHQASLEFSWRFLPQTALLSDTQISISNYMNPAGSPTQLADGFTVSSRIGINGAFTRKFSLLAMVGYVAGFYSGGDDYDSVSGDLEGRIRFTRDIQFALGYQRSYANSALGNYFSTDRGYLKLDMLFGGKFLLSLNGDVGFINYGEIIGDEVSSADRSDVTFGASLFGEYRFTDWLAGNATISYRGRSTDFQFTGAALVDPVENYNKVEFWLGARLFY